MRVIVGYNLCYFKFILSIFYSNVKFNVILRSILCILSHGYTLPTVCRTTRLLKVTFTFVFLAALTVCGDNTWLYLSPDMQNNDIYSKNMQKKEREAPGCQCQSSQLPWMFGTFHHAPYSLLWEEVNQQSRWQKPLKVTKPNCLLVMYQTCCFAGDNCCSAPLWPTDSVWEGWTVLQDVWARYVNTMCFCIIKNHLGQCYFYYAIIADTHYLLRGCVPFTDYKKM